MLPTGKSMTMREVREIDEARTKLKKKEEEEFKKRLAARNKKVDPAKERLRLEMEADRKERAARGPVTQGSVALAKGSGAQMTASEAGCSGTSAGG